MRAAFVLARLALRRALPWPLFACVTVVLVLGVLPGAALPDSVAVEDLALGRMLARARVWIISGALAVLVCVPRAAVAGAAARKVDGDFLAASPLPRWVDALATWLGTAGAGCAVLLVGAACAEVAAGGTGPALGRVETFANPQLRLVENIGARWELPPSAALRSASDDPGARLSLEVLALPREGPATILSAFIDAQPKAGTAIERLLSGRTRLYLPLPAGEQHALIVQRDDRGASAVVPSGTVELSRPAPFGERSATLRLLSGGSVALAAACALALGFSTWVAAWIAALGVLAAFALPSVLGLASPSGARIGPLLMGEVPTALGAVELLSWSGVTALGLVLASSARGRKREG